ncbi:MAG: lipocalin family protein [Bacteroidota bacterium]
MKLKHVFSGILLVSAMAFVSCKGKPKDMIVNKWKATDMSGGMMGSVPDSVKKNMISTISIEFTKDGKYMAATGTSTDNGTYSLSDDGKSLTMTANGGKVEESTVEEITKSKLVIVDKASSTKIVMEPK